MPLVIKSNEDKEQSPHLALCHEAQGFSANNRHISLLMKSGVVLTQEVIKALDVLGVNKAAFYSQIRTQISSAVQEKFGDKEDWLYVEDFNDEVVIFCNEKGLWSSSYSLTESGVQLDDLANPVNSVLTYVPADGKMLLSEDAEDKLEEGVYELVTKSLSTPTTQEHLVKVFKAKHDYEVKLLEQEIKKAVEEAELVLKAQLKEKEEFLQKALEEIEQYKQEKKEAVAKARKDAIAAVEKDAAEAESLFKSLESLADEAFDVVLKSLKKQKDKLEESDLFVEKGANSQPAADKQEDKTAALLKAKYAK